MKVIARPHTVEGNSCVGVCVCVASFPLFCSCCAEAPLLSLSLSGVTTSGVWCVVGPKKKKNKKNKKKHLFCCSRGRGQVFFFNSWKSVVFSLCVRQGTEMWLRLKNRCVSATIARRKAVQPLLLTRRRISGSFPSSSEVFEQLQEIEVVGTALNKSGAVVEVTAKGGGKTKRRRKKKKKAHAPHRGCVCV